MSKSEREKEERMAHWNAKMGIVSRKAWCSSCKQVAHIGGRTPFEYCQSCGADVSPDSEAPEDHEDSELLELDRELLHALRSDIDLWPLGEVCYPRQLDEIARLLRRRVRLVNKAKKNGV